MKRENYKEEGSMIITPTPRRSPCPSSSSSSDFEFIVSLSPSSRNKSSSTSLCTADELFYKGQLLPLQLSPRISMLRTLLLSSSSTNSSDDTNTTASRDSNGSTSSTSSSSSSNIPAELLLLLHPECDSSCPSSVTEEEASKVILTSSSSNNTNNNKRNKYLASFAHRFSSVFLNRGGSKKVDLSSSMDIDLDHHAPAKRDKDNNINASSSAAKQVIKKYVNKVKRFSPLQKSQNQNQNGHNQQVQHKKKTTFSFSIRKHRDITLGNCSNIVDDTIIKKLDHDRDSVDMRGIYTHSHSFSGNLRFPRRKKCAGSCPSSMRSSPTHSGLLRIGTGSVAGGFPSDLPALVSSSSSSSMEELQSAIQGAIAHCKSSMILSHHKKPVNGTTTVN